LEGEKNREREDCRASVDFSARLLPPSKSVIFLFFSLLFLLPPFPGIRKRARKKKQGRIHTDTQTVIHLRRLRRKGKNKRRIGDIHTPASPNIPIIISSHIHKRQKKMKLQFGFLAMWLTLALAQTGQMLDCTEDVIQSEECAEVISPIACYNQFRWNQQTLTCIEGTDAEKRMKVCCSYFLSLLCLLPWSFLELASRCMLT
jgi:hypothetical protein